MTANEIKYELGEAVFGHFPTEFKAGTIIVTEREEHLGRGIEYVIINESKTSIWTGEFLDGIYNILKGTQFKYVIEDDVMTIFEI